MNGIYDFFITFATPFKNFWTLSMKTSPIHGRGLFAQEPIASGEIVCIKGGHIFNKVITGQDWRRKDLQEKYAGYMSWYLLEKIRNAT